MGPVAELGNREKKMLVASILQSKGDPFGERLAEVAEAQNILLMACDQCSLRRNLAEGEFGQCGNGSMSSEYRPSRRQPSLRT